MADYSYAYHLPIYNASQEARVYAVSVHHQVVRPQLLITALALLVSTIGASLTYALPSRYQVFTTSPARPAPAQAAAPIQPKPATVAPSTTPPPAAHPDSQALQAVLDNWQHDYATSHFGVVMKELTGAQRTARLDADTPLPAASLYKLYLAQYLYNKIDSGQLSLDTSLNTPYNVGECLKQMIVVSDNVCPQAMATYFGWISFNRAVQAAGFAQTNVLTINTTSPNDVAEYLEQLQSGTMLTQTSTQSLLTYMKQQVYRSGIPAGVPGIEVADKVGILGTAWNDAAIVYHPNGAYILVVMSQNANVAAIKDLSTRISNFMNQ